MRPSTIALLCATFPVEMWAGETTGIPTTTGELTPRLIRVDMLPSEQMASEGMSTMNFVCLFNPWVDFFAENVSLHTSVMQAIEKSIDRLSADPEKFALYLQDESDERYFIGMEDGMDLLFLLRKLLRIEDAKRLCRAKSESPRGPHPHEGVTV